MGEEYEEQQPVPVLHRPHRSGDRRGDARRAPREVERTSGIRRATRRTRRRVETFERSKLEPPRGRAPVHASCSRCARRLPRELDVSADGKRVTLDARRGDARARLRREDRRAADSEPRALAGTPVPARCDVGRRGHELLALLRERGARRALPLRRRRQGGARRAARADGVQLARLPARASARASATRTASTATGRRRRARASTRASCCSIPYAKAIDGAIDYDGPSTLPYVPNGDDADLDVDTDDDAAAMPKCVVVDESFDWEGRRRRRARACRGTRPSSTRCTSRASRRSTPTCARTCAARTRASPRTRRSST